MTKNREKRAGRLRTVWRFSRKYGALFLVAELCILASYAIFLLLPLNLTRLTDEVLYGGRYDQLGAIALSYAVLFGAAVAFNLLYAYVWQTLSNRYVVDVKCAVYDRAVAAAPAWLTSMDSGDVMSRIDADSDQFIHVIQKNVFHFLNSALLCGGVLVMVARINIPIAVMLAAAALLPILLTRLCGPLSERAARQARETDGMLTGRVYELMGGMREIRLLGARSWARKRFLGPVKELQLLGNRQRRIGFGVEEGIKLLNLITTLLIWGYAAYLIAAGNMTVGWFVAIVSYIGLLHRKFNWMLRIALDWYARKVSIDRVAEMLEVESEDPSGQPVPRLDTVEFRKVSFGYGDGENVLKEFSLTIRPGEKIGVVGVSGAGKTTLTGLLMKFYSPRAGQILINGRDLADCRYEDVRARIGLVGQDVLLFRESVRYNLLFGSRRKAYSDEELLTLCDRVGLREVVDRLPQGLDTLLGDGVDLSGGQKQRLMIARVLLRQADLVILDEATSALDVPTEAAVVGSILRACREQTMLVISHRLAAVRPCDRIVVLEDGRVAACGSHEELLRGSPLYRAMFGPEKEEAC